jgi:hypothetical protein
MYGFCNRHKRACHANLNLLNREQGGSHAERGKLTDKFHVDISL